MGNEFWVTEYARIYANPAPAVNEVPRMPPNPPISWHVFQLCKQEVVGSSPIISTRETLVILGISDAAIERTFPRTAARLRLQVTSFRVAAGTKVGAEPYDHAR